jgi:hypothetical protein
MMKELLWSMLQGGLPLLLLIAALVGAYKFFRQLSDPAWLLAALLSMAVMIGGVAFQARRFADGIPGNDLIDVTYVTYLIGPLFALAVGINGSTVYRLSRERRDEARGVEGSVRRRLRELRAVVGSKVAAFDEVHGELHDREAIPLLIKQMLPTLGLIGTVAGLAIAMGKLGEALAAAVGGGQGGSDELLLAMQQAMAGMGGAFLTTLFGAGCGLLLLVLTNRAARLFGQVLMEADKKLGGDSRTPSTGPGSLDNPILPNPSNARRQKP